jgi:thiol-disulfide isomerase/thioredoxin
MGYYDLDLGLKRSFPIWEKVSVQFEADLVNATNHVTWGSPAGAVGSGSTPPTFSSLRGKIVLVSFWATECGTCRKEMQDLDLIYTHYQQQGLVILSITDENPVSVNQSLSRMNYHPEVLIDDSDKVGKAFHVDGVPRTFVFDRDGKLAAESIDMCTQMQFFSMLRKAGLEPNK